MGEKQRMRLQSCRADVRVRRKDGELKMKVLRYKSLVDCLSVDEGGNGSESKSNNFKMINWEGVVYRLLSITTSDDKKHTFKLKQVPAAAANDLILFWVDLALNESRDLFAGVGVLKNVYTELIELPQILAEAPPVKKVPMAKYDPDKKTLTYSKDKLGSGDRRFLASIVGRTIELGLFDNPTDWVFDHGVVEQLYAKFVGLSVEGDNVIFWLTTDGIRTKGKYAKEKVEALNKVNSGDYYVGINPLYTDGAAFIPTAAGRYSEQRRYFQQGPLSLDIGDVIMLANGRSRVGFKAKDARTVFFDAATETISSVLSNKYIEGMIKTGDDAPQLGIKLRVKTKSGDWVIAMDNLEKNGDIWAGEAWWTVSFSSDDIVDAWLSSGSYIPLLNFPSWF